MTGFYNSDGTLNEGVVWQLLQELEAGTIEAGSLDELMALLESSSEARKGYLAYFELNSMLESEAATCDEENRLPIVEKSGVRKGLFAQSLLAAAAVLVLGILVASFVMTRQKSPSVFTATVMNGTQWSVQNPSQNSASQVTGIGKGAHVRVASGVVQLKGEDGAVLMMQGPAHVSFPALNRPLVHEGWLWFDSNESGQSYQVQTARLQIRNLGTRFGIFASRGKAAEVHLIEGKVEVTAKSTNKVIAHLEPEDWGVSLPESGEATVVDLARDPFPELDDLLAAAANYKTVVRSQNPVSYWRLEKEEISGAQVNEIEDGSVGRRSFEVSERALGPGPSEGFFGFSPDNGALALSNRQNRSQLSLGTTPDHEGVLFQEDFEEEGRLHASAPDISFNGAHWVSGSLFRRDGSTGFGRASATLSFTPVDDAIYTLEATVTTLDGPNEDWIGVGFGSGQRNTNDRSNSDPTARNVWMLHRAANTTKPVNRSWLSTKASDWNWSGTSPLGGTMDLRIVLDTTAGPGGWTATWYAKRPSERDYQLVRGSESLKNESISSVGLLTVGNKLTAKVESFRLKAERRSPTSLDLELANGPAGMKKEQGTISCWLRRASDFGEGELIWTAGEGKRNDIIQLHFTDDGRAGLFLENGRYDVLIASEVPVTPNQWHHVVASWSPREVTLYLNGQMVARDTEFRGMHPGLMSELRVGGKALNTNYRSFTGLLDEVALWDRALTPTEIFHQFRAAK